MASPTVSKGSDFPSGAKLVTCPYDEDVAKGGQCPAPIPFSLDKYQGKKFILVAVPGAFTPTCSEKHIPPYVKHAKELREKVDAVIVISANDPFVLHGWANALNGYNKDIIFASDGNAAFSKSIGLAVDMSAKGMQERTWRYAMVVDDGKIKYLGVEEDAGVATVSGYDEVVKHL